MKQFLKKITGIAAIEAAKAKAVAELEAAREAAIEASNKSLADIAEQLRKSTEEAEASKKAAEEAAEKERIAKLTPKERATLNGEPYVDVLETHVNKDDIRNGFFELDWNDLFIVQLKQSGYGFDGDPDNQIVDRWFRDLAANMLVEDGQDPVRPAGYINFQKLPGGKGYVE